MTTEQTTAHIVTHTPGGKLVTHGGSGNAYTNYGCRCEECRAANTRRVNRRRRHRSPESGAFEHGAGGYRNWNCRCDVCSEAHREAMARAKASRAERAATQAPHGTSAAYTGWGCRCEPCKDANSLYRRANYLRSKARWST